MLTLCAQPTRRVRGAELGLWDFPPSALSLPPDPHNLELYRETGGGYTEQMEPDTAMSS